MANILTSLTPKILAMAQVTLRENIVLPFLVYRDLNTDARRQGTTVDVPLPYPMGMAEDVTPSVIPAQAPDIQPTHVSVPLNRWKKKSFYMTDRDLGSVVQGVVPMQLVEAARSLANSIDYDLWSLYQQVHTTIGTGGEVPFQDVSPPTQVYHGLRAAQEARRALNQNLAPLEDRVIALGVDSEANATGLPQFTSAADAGTDITIRNGVIGRKLGYDWFMSQNAPTHTNGTTTATSITASGIQTAGSPTLTVAGADTVGVGDVFSIAGNSQQYTILAGSTTGIWNIEPALAADLAGGETISLYPADGTNINLAFHRNAFAFVSRPLLDVQGLGSVIESFTDPETGITLRLEVSRQHKQTQYELDVLYGCAVLRPELAVRIYG